MLSRAHSRPATPIRPTVRGRHKLQQLRVKYDTAKQKSKHVKYELNPSDHQAHGQLPAGWISPLPAAAVYAIRMFLHYQA